MHAEWRARLKTTTGIKTIPPESDSLSLLGKKRYTALLSTFKREARGSSRVETYLLEFMLRSNGFSPSKNEIRQFEESTRNGTFSLDEFLSFASKCESVSRGGHALSELMAFFKPYDTQNTGLIPEPVFITLMMNCGERFSQEELDSVLNAFKSAENMGFIDYRSFLTTYDKIVYSLPYLLVGSRVISENHNLQWYFVIL
jgi:Ca2+-binding EF-hand superfamily protein